MSEAPEATAPPVDGLVPETTPADPSQQDDGQVQTFDRSYVEQLRREAAASRTRAQEAEGRLQEIADRDKTEQQKLAERAEAAEKAAAETAERLARFEVAADKGLEPKYTELLTGSREEMEAKADLLLEALKPPPVDPAAFDGGVRTTSTDSAGLTPEQQHRQTLQQLLGGQ